MKNKDAQKLAAFLFEVGTLRRIPRMHRQNLLVDDTTDTIASHTFRVAVIGWFLAQEEHADAAEVVLMCLFHDVEEARSGDHNWIHKRYVKVFEDEIVRDQTNGLPGGRELAELRTRYTERTTREAKLAKDADLLDQLLLLKEYAHAGNKEAEKWLEGRREAYLDDVHASFSCQTSREAATAILAGTPSDWWGEVWTSENR